MGGAEERIFVRDKSIAHTHTHTRTNESKSKKNGTMMESLRRLFALPRQQSCANTVTFDALRLAGLNAANGVRTRRKPSRWRLIPRNFKDPDSSESTRAWRNRTHDTRQPDGAQDTTISSSQTTRLQAQVTSPSQSLWRSIAFVLRVIPFAQRSPVHLHPRCT